MVVSVEPHGGTPFVNKSIVISDGTEVIGDRALEELYEMERTSIPSSVIKMGSNPFKDFSNLVRKEVSSDNSEYTAEEGFLFTKDKTILIACPQSKSGSYQVPNGIVEIGKRAFYRCTSLEDVMLPPS